MRKKRAQKGSGKKATAEGKQIDRKKTKRVKRKKLQKTKGRPSRGAEGLPLEKKKNDNRGTRKEKKPSK